MFSWKKFQSALISVRGRILQKELQQSVCQWLILNLYVINLCARKEETPCMLFIVVQYIFEENSSNFSNPTRYYSWAERHLLVITNRMTLFEFFKFSNFLFYTVKWYCVFDIHRLFIFYLLTLKWLGFSFSFPLKNGQVLPKTIFWCVCSFVFFMFLPSGIRCQRLVYCVDCISVKWCYVSFLNYNVFLCFTLPWILLLVVYCLRY